MESYIRLPNSTQSGYEKVAILINATDKVDNDKLMSLNAEMIRWLLKRKYLDGYDMVVISHVKHRSQSTKNIAMQLVAGCNIPPSINDNLAVNGIIKQILTNDKTDGSKLSVFTLDNGQASELVGEFKVSHFIPFYA